MTKRGFAGMDREKVRAIASAGGKAAHAAGTAHEFTTEEAKAAGRKGGLANAGRRKCGACGKISRAGSSCECTKTETTT